MDRDMMRRIREESLQARARIRVGLKERLAGRDEPLELPGRTDNPPAPPYLCPDCGRSDCDGCE